MSEEQTKCLEEFSKASGQLRAEFLSWGCPAGNVKKDHGKRLGEWIELVKKYPGFLFDLSHAAARLGITLASFKRLKSDSRIAACVCSWALPEGDFYYAPLIEGLYDSLLDRNKVYSTILSSNEKVARELNAEQSCCCICREFSVYTVCDYCNNSVDTAHVEPLNSLRPMSFQPEQVCWRCLFASPPQSYLLILSEDKVKESLCKAIEDKWLDKCEINNDWLESIGDHQYQSSKGIL
jgi:hypothetical protein